MGGMGAEPRVRHRFVEYQRLTQISKITDVNVEELPFYKRWPYGDEAEYRVVFVDPTNKMNFQDVVIKPSWIRRITLSPWLSPALVAAVKDTIKSIHGCGNLKVYQ